MRFIYFNQLVSALKAIFKDNNFPMVWLVIKYRNDFKMQMNKIKVKLNLIKTYV